MSPAIDPTAGGDSPIDWVKARAFLRARLSSALVAEDPAVLEDLAQEASIRLLRTTRRQEVRNLEALMNVIADRTRIDHIRARRVQRGTFTGMDEAAERAAGAHSIDTGFRAASLQRLQFVVLEFFDQHNVACRDLARQFFAEREWAEVARRTGRTADAVRQQWSRCVHALAKSVATSTDPLWAWARARAEEEP